MNESNTSMGTVPGTAPGAGALAPAPEELTCNGFNVRAFLRRANCVGRALSHFERGEARGGISRGTWGHYYEAVRLLRGDWDYLVECVREAGGLLHLGRVY